MKGLERHEGVTCQGPDDSLLGLCPENHRIQKGVFSHDNYRYLNLNMQLL